MSALTGILPVVTIEDAAAAPNLARALLAGGLTAVEVTLRTPDALKAIAAIRAEVPALMVGAGTVLTPGDVEAARNAGAAFGLAPGLDSATVHAAAAAGWMFVPGVASASEIQAGIGLGLNFFKFFPAVGAGGTAWLSAMAGPFADITFCPTGGITADNAHGFLALPNVRAIGGSWIAPPSLIAAGDFDQITRRAAAAAALGP